MNSARHENGNIKRQSPGPVEYWKKQKNKFYLLQHCTSVVIQLLFHTCMTFNSWPHMKLSSEEKLGLFFINMNPDYIKFAFKVMEIGASLKAGLHWHTLVCRCSAPILFPVTFLLYFFSVSFKYSSGLLCKFWLLCKLFWFFCDRGRSCHRGKRDHVRSNIWGFIVTWGEGGISPSRTMLARF